MLELLAKYARDHDLVAEPGFVAKDVRWAIVCDADGRFLGINELGDTESKRNRGRRFAACPDLSLPEMKRGGVTKSHFLVDTVEVVALLTKSGAEPAVDPKVLAKHAYFIGLLRQASDDMRELALFAQCLDDSDALEAIRRDLGSAKARPADKVTLAVHGRQPPFVVESDAWHDWWRRFRGTLAPPKPKRSKITNAGLARCLVTGELTEPVATHPKITGLADVGGLAMGDALLSYKQASFCSYGLQQAANAPVSDTAAAGYRAALNDLLAQHGHRLAGAKVVHWFKSHVPPEHDPLPWLEDPTDELQELTAQQRARELLQAIRRGEYPELLDNRYYALTLSGAAGRVMVRDWMQGQFEDLVANVGAWFDDLAIVRRDGSGPAPSPKFLAVCGATVRELDELAPPFVARMWHVALRKEEPIPRSAMAQALHRAKLDILRNDPPNHARMGLLKAFHLRNEKGDRTMHVSLNPDHPDPAYHCGRLMAVLADVQYAALGDVGAGVVQRFYAAASSTPALVLGRLVRTAQFHLSKPKVDKVSARGFNDLIAEVQNAIHDRMPRTLTLEQQSLFALGYYHQIAHNRAKRSRKNNTPHNDEKE